MNCDPVQRNFNGYIDGALDEILGSAGGGARRGLPGMREGSPRVCVARAMASRDSTARNIAPEGFEAAVRARDRSGTECPPDNSGQQAGRAKSSSAGSRNGAAPTAHVSIVVLAGDTFSYNISANGGGMERQKYATDGSESLPMRRHPIRKTVLAGTHGCSPSRLRHSRRKRGKIAAISAGGGHGKHARKKMKAPGNRSRSSV